MTRLHGMTRFLLILMLATGLAGCSTIGGWFGDKRDDTETLPVEAMYANGKEALENQNYQRTSHVPEALHRLVEAYLSVGMIEEAQRMAAILGHNFPGNQWYERSYALMTDAGVAPVAQEEAERRGWLSRTFGAVF